MNSTLKEKLISLADKYEIASFCDSDPSQFLRHYPIDKIVDVECASFIAAMLAFGNRKQFIPKIQQTMELANKTCGSISAWLIAGNPDFLHGEKKFYRFYSYDDMHCLFGEIAEILKKYNSLGEYFRIQWNNKNRVLGTESLGEGVVSNEVDTRGRLSPLDTIISDSFPKSAIVPKGKNSANKRIHMFLRWMVRQNSPVDLGIWNWYSPADLLIPLDVHVMQEGINLGLLAENAKATRKTAIELTKKMGEIFPGDPARADFALFGLGVDLEKKAIK